MFFLLLPYLENTISQVKRNTFGVLRLLCRLVHTGLFGMEIFSFLHFFDILMYFANKES